MEDSFKNTVIAFILFSLFGMLIISAVIGFGGDYNKDLTQVTGGSLSLSKFNESVSSVEQNSKNLKASFEEGNVWSSIAGVVVEGVFKIALNIVDMILAPFDILSDILSDILGVPYYVTSVLLGLMILALIFGIWNLIKIGN